MRVVEIFDSIDGEGIRAGELATFVRLAGCNVRCSYCDTPYALEAPQGKAMSIPEVLEEVIKIGNKNVTLTGGEPLIHSGALELVRQLVGGGFCVNIETNGTVDIRPYLMDGVTITMDYKTIESGVNDKMLLSNIVLLRNTDVLKAVCASGDFDDIRKMLLKYKPRSYVYLSPIYGKIDPVELVDFLKRLRNEGICVDRARVQLQLHKIIWNPDTKGV